MIKVFKVPSGKRQYLPLYRQIQESGIWQILDVTKSQLAEEWLIKAVKKDYFSAQTPERQAQIAKGERRSNY